MTIGVHQGIELLHQAEPDNNERRQPSGMNHKEADEGRIGVIESRSRKKRRRDLETRERHP